MFYVGGRGGRGALPKKAKYSWFAMMSSKTKVLDNVNNPVLKGLCKFQVNIMLLLTSTEVHTAKYLDRSFDVRTD